MKKNSDGSYITVEEDPTRNRLRVNKYEQDINHTFDFGEMIVEINETTLERLCPDDNGRQYYVMFLGGAHGTELFDGKIEEMPQEVHDQISANQ